MLPERTTDKKKKYYEHQFLRPHTIEWRDYQVNITQQTHRQNTLVVLPTALGKTIIALITALKVLEEKPDSKIFVLAPTRPLVMQHYRSFQQFLKPSIKCSLFSSNLSAVQRAWHLNDAHFIFSTPQIIQNDLKSEMYDLSSTGLMIVDESHKARKRYAYTGVAQMYLEQSTCPLILALTASPGKDLTRINELCETLQIENIIFRDSSSPDVKDYTHAIDTIVKRIELPNEILTAAVVIDTALRQIQNYFISNSLLPQQRYFSKVTFIRLIQDLKKLEILLDQHRGKAKLTDYGFRDEELNFPHLLDHFTLHPNFASVNRTAFFQAINGIYLEHLKEILTTQDVRMVWTYLEKLEGRANSGNRRIRRLLNSKYILGIKKILRPVKQSPKIPVLLDIIRSEMEMNPNAKLIIFTQYREMGIHILKKLQSPALTHTMPGSTPLRPVRFVGQANQLSNAGMNQKEQTGVISEFSNGIYNVLIATSVAEEGLDIPSVDAVVFYEAIPSEIRLIQRRGRTGRHREGRCYCLIAQDSLDQIYHAVSHRKEQKMHDLLQQPGAVATVDKVERSSKKITHQKRTMEEIKEARKEAKRKKQGKVLEKVEEKIAQAAVHRPKGMELVTDMTQALFAKSTKRPDAMPKKN